MKGQRKRRLSAVLAVAVCMASVGWALLRVPFGAWVAVGRQAAQLAVGLRSPSDSVELWNEARTSPTTGNTMPVEAFVGEGVTRRVTTTATVQRQDGAVEVITQQMSAGSEFVDGVAVRNKLGKTVDIAAALAHVPKLSLKKGLTAPQVLITHTHTTECYAAHDSGFANPSDPTRTDDPTKNMIAVGERVASELRAAGIGVIHDTEIHDQPYSGAYGHAKTAIERYLKQYPSIKVVLDLHRDAIYQSDGAHIKPTATIGGTAAAQIMIIVGMKNTSAVPNTHTAENLAFGVRLQQALHERYPGIARPLLLADARYNQQLTNGSLLIEMGSDANTLEEACYSGTLLGKAAAQVLQELGA